jgi:hypothetical protein
MPDLRYCVKQNGKIYCFDVERRKLVEVIIQDVPVSPEVADIFGGIIASYLKDQTGLDSA